jgi:glycosyltransferase involved in cell wall biosynthesis
LTKNNSDDFYVQLPFLKQQLIDQHHINPKQIHVSSTYQFTSLKNPEAITTRKGYYIYPATPFHYKNHHMILGALKLLPESIKRNIVIEFTFDANDNAYSIKLSNIVIENQLPVKFIGSLDHESLIEKYNSYTLLYPSLLESLGFPLIEAKSIYSPIMAIDLSYSREALGNYENVTYFKSLEELIKIFSKSPDDNLVKTIVKSPDNPHPSLLSNLNEVLT